MSIRGGVFTRDNTTELSFSIEGGKQYKRIYSNVVDAAINKFVVISKALNDIISANSTEVDKVFFINQVKILLNRAHVEMIQGSAPFQQKYNMWLLDGYIRMILETTDMYLITQLLDLDSILYSIEYESIQQGNHIQIDFEIPNNIKVHHLSVDHIKKYKHPIDDDLNTYVNSLNENLQLLSEFVQLNRSCFEDIHGCIIKVASKYLH